MIDDHFDINDYIYDIHANTGHTTLAAETICEFRHPEGEYCDTKTGKTYRFKCARCGGWFCIIHLPRAKAPREDETTPHFTGHACEAGTPPLPSEEEDAKTIRDTHRTKAKETQIIIFKAARDDGEVRPANMPTKALNNFMTEQGKIHDLHTQLADTYDATYRALLKRQTILLNPPSTPKKKTEGKLRTKTPHMRLVAQDVSHPYVPQNAGNPEVKPPTQNTASANAHIHTDGRTTTHTQESKPPSKPGSQSALPPPLPKRRPAEDPPPPSPPAKSMKQSNLHGAQKRETDYTTAWQLLQSPTHQGRPVSTTQEEEGRDNDFTLGKFLTALPHRYRTGAAPFIYYCTRQGKYHIALEQVHDLRPTDFGNYGQKEHHDRGQLKEAVQQLIRHHKSRQPGAELPS